ncbi:MAG: carboxypeptidase-like regulatory domain-containing protein [Bryobacteraceae bacterium]|nr:carboxypeptidase-like regulatory domain-containing protein [Bryobacteraceae bacterium]
MFRTAFVLLLWTVPPGLAQTEAAQWASLAGRVTNAVTGAPVARAEVELIAAGSEQTGTYATTSSVDGRFAFDKVTPGVYRLRVEHSTFLAQEFGARRPFAAGRTLLLTAADSLPRAFDVAILPQNVLAGRVVDGDGAPIPSVRVRAMQWGYVRGKKTLLSFGVPLIGAHTDDEGRFRISGLVPGTYLVIAEFQPTDSGKENRPSLAGKRWERFVATYYPGSPQVGGAVPMALAAGERHENILLQMVKQPAFRVAGRVDWADGRPPAPVRIAFQPADSTTGLDLIRGFGGFCRHDGSFAFERIPSGAYFVAIVAMTERGPLILLRQRIDISDDLRDLNLLVPSPVRVAGEFSRLVPIR